MYPPDLRVPDAPYSMIVAKCRLVAIYRVPPPSARRNAVLEAGYNIRLAVGAGQEEFIEGPYCWVLADIEPLAIPFNRGERGLYEIDLDKAIANGPAVADLLAAKATPKPRKPRRSALAELHARQLEEWNARRDRA